MSFIAAVLILNLDTADAFIAFANLLNKPCQMAFFRVDHSLVSTYTLTYLHMHIHLAYIPGNTLTHMTFRIVIAGSDTRSAC